MMFGFACDESPEYMPAPISMAHKLARRLAEARKSGELPFLRPDGKSQVSIQYGPDGAMQRLAAIVLSAQHAEDVSIRTLREALHDSVIPPRRPGAFHRQEYQDLLKPHGPLRRGRTDGRLRPDGAQDHRGHLRRLFQPRRRLLLRQGPHQGSTAPRPIWPATLPRISSRRAREALPA